MSSGNIVEGATMKFLQGYESGESSTENFTDNSEAMHTPHESGDFSLSEFAMGCWEVDEPQPRETPSPHGRHARVPIPGSPARRTSVDVPRGSPGDPFSGTIALPIGKRAPPMATPPDRTFYVDIMHGLTVYDIIADSSKIVVLNTLLSVSRAFRALVDNNVHSAPLWDSEEQRYIGIITISDFIDILRHFYQSPLAGMEQLNTLTLRGWREITKPSHTELIHVTPEVTVHDAAHTLISNRLHRLPIITPEHESVVSIITPTMIMDHVLAKAGGQFPSFWNRTIEELNIGTYRNIITIATDTPLIVVLNVMCGRRVTAVPVVDETGRPVDVFSKSDVFALARQQAYYDLDITVESAIASFRTLGETEFYTCTVRDSLNYVLTKLQNTRCFRLIVVDSSEAVVGVVSIGDVLKYCMDIEHDNG